MPERLRAEAFVILSERREAPRSGDAKDPLRMTGGATLAQNDNLLLSPRMITGPYIIG